MSDVKELDLGPLTWVKSEIDLALAKAVEALDKAATNREASATNIQFAQTHLHQACGALSIVGLDGVTQFASSLEQLLGTLARGERAVSDEVLELCRHSLAATGNYLEELVHGSPDQPLRLFGLYRQLAKTRGLPDPSPAELFYPDTSARPARKLKPSTQTDAAAIERDTRRFRAIYQRGLLKVLRGEDVAGGAREMQSAARGIESIQDKPAAMTFWWVVQVFFEGIASGSLAPEPPIKRLCSMLERELRRDTGTGSLPERLMRELLYYIARTPAATPAQKAARDTWRLDALLPEDGAAVSEVPLAPLLKALRTELGAAKRAWDDFSGGKAAALPVFQGHVSRLGAEARQLCRPALDRLLQGLSGLAQWLRQDPLVFNDTVAIEVASAQLLVESALGEGGPEAGFSAQVGDTLERLDALIRGKPLPKAELSATVKTARRTEERDALNQVGREILSNLAHVEQRLDDFFRNQSKRAPLATLSAPLKQIEGALSLVGDEQATHLIRKVSSSIEELAQGTEAAPAAIFEDLARQLSALGFYVQALQHGHASLATFLDPERAAQAEAAEVRPVELEDLDLGVPPVTEEIAPPVVRAEEKAPPAAAEPEPTAEAPVPTAEAAAAAAPTEAEDEIDAELLGIFIEEAHEVLATVGEQLALSRANPADMEALTSVRRGFHTLKGSGRMVGLNALGEAAWAVEQTLNRWLQMEWTPSARLHDLIAQAAEAFSAWVAQIEGGGGLDRDATAIVALAEGLREAEPVAEPAGTTTAEATSARPSEPQGGTSTAIVPEPALDDTSAGLTATGADFFDLQVETNLEADLLDSSLEAPAFLLDQTIIADIGREFGEDGEYDQPATATEVVSTSDFRAPQLDASDAAAAVTDTDATIDLVPLDVAPLAELEADRRYPDTGHRTEVPVQPPSDDVPAMGALDVEPLPVSGDDTETLAAFEASQLETQPVDAFTGESEAVEGQADANYTPASAQALPGVTAEREAIETAETAYPAPDDGGMSAIAPVAEDVDKHADLDLEEPGLLETPLEDELYDALEATGQADIATVEPALLESVRIGDVELSPTLYELFVGEAAQHIATLQSEFDQLRANPTRPPSEGALRAAHTLAGISGTARVQSMHVLARGLEHAIERLRIHDLAAREDQVELLDAVTDRLDAMLAEVTTGLMPLEVPEFEHPLSMVGADALDDLTLMSPSLDEVTGDAGVAGESSEFFALEDVSPEPSLFEAEIDALPEPPPSEPSVTDLGSGETAAAEMAPDTPIEDQPIAEVATGYDASAEEIFFETSPTAPAPLEDAGVADVAAEAQFPDSTATYPASEVLDTAEASAPAEATETTETVEATDRTHTPDDLAAFAPKPAPPVAAQALVAEAEPAMQVHDDIDEQLLPIFIEEATELLAELHATLRDWAESPSDPDQIKATARLLHTLKGSARMTGAMTLGEHIHQLESRLEAGLAAGHEMRDLIEEVTAGADQTQLMMDAIVAGEPAPLPEAATTTQQQAAVATGSAVAIEAAAASETGGGMLRVRADTVDRFVNEAGEIGIARTRIEGELRTLRRSLLDLTENVIRLRNQLREVEIQAEVQMQSRIAQAEMQHADFDPLEMDRYTRLQELTRLMAESVGDVTTVQQNLFRNLDGAEIALHSQARLSRDLQQALMQVRMVPFDSLADRLYRVVRQSAKDLGKRVNLDIRGGRIEVDRSVLDRMTAPLEHLLRNAVAHGIEMPDVRRSAGKDEIGQITLAVTHEANEIQLNLSDDGKGLDYDAIATRARERGLLGADEEADTKRLTNLIFVPGFSTAETLSTVSGRGVGMDVVKADTAAVGGRIDVFARPSQGTEFRIFLPLTLAVTQAVLVRAGGYSYAIPSNMVAQVLELKEEGLQAIRDQGYAEWNGERFAFRYLPELLGEHAEPPETHRFSWVLLLRAGAQTLALHVDSLRGNQEIVVKNAGPQLVRIIGISGATVLGDGEIVLILNPVALASRALGGDARAADAPAPRPAPPVVVEPTVMIVDDSLTVRKITGRLLEREGFRVVTAKDGADALEKLLETIPDVILSDIEMPRMDGFDLVRNIRADERTREVPIIMITSRLADKHRQYALKVGANHYLGKPYEEGELLGLIRSYTDKTAVPA
ncbi:MAG: Hpt domain-containing protein [Rhodocyclaceae bacterium]